MCCLLQLEGDSREVRMENRELFKEMQRLVANDLELQEKPQATEDLLLEAVRQRVVYLLAHRLEYFFTLLYRLDVSEAAVREALDPAYPRPAAERIAELIVEREKEKAATRLKYRSRDYLDDEDHW